MAHKPDEEGDYPHNATSFIACGTHAWYTGLWSTLEGSIYVTRHDGWIVRNPDIFGPDARTTWKSDFIEGLALRGVFGIDDTAVFVWGDRFGKLASEIHRWDGAGWLPMQDPGFSVTAMHGTAVNSLWAAGSGGQVARWDGEQWIPVPNASAAFITSLWLAGPDEVYATTAGGHVLEGGFAGLTAIGTIPGATLPGDVTSVAKWRGKLWVGANRLGLWVRVGDTATFECIKPHIDCVSMDARDNLVLCCNNRVSGSAEGERFRSYGVDCLLDDRAQYRLGQNLG